MESNKDVCVKCTKSNDCATREEIHADNFYVSECDEIVSIKEEETV